MMIFLISPYSITHKLPDLGFFTPEVRLVFTKLRLAFIENLIFNYFDPKCYILIELNLSSYAINEVFH